MEFETTSASVSGGTRRRAGRHPYDLIVRELTWHPGSNRWDVTERQTHPSETAARAEMAKRISRTCAVTPLRQYEVVVAPGISDTVSIREGPGGPRRPDHAAGTGPGGELPRRKRAESQAGGNPGSEGLVDTPTPAAPRSMIPYLE